MTSARGSVTKVPSIIEAMDSVQLFRPWFNGPSWDNWRSVLKATTALPMTSEEVLSFKAVAGGREPPRKRPRENWFVVGRRGGKDSITSLIAAYAARSPSCVSATMAKYSRSRRARG